MNGVLAQLVALTCHGNAFLANPPETRFFPTNSTCQFCERVTFATMRTGFFGKSKETEVARDPDSWFAQFKSRGALGFRLSRAPQNNPGIPDRMSAAFVGGGGSWTLEVLLPRGESEFWTARWEVGDQQAADKRIWRVTYVRVAVGKSQPFSARQLSECLRELEDSLKETRAFSATQNLDGFTKCFDDALDAIGTRGRNRHGHHQDLAPAGFLSEDAAILLDACQTSWVFGGMGSWNDLGFDGDEQKTYDRVSERLFQAVNLAIEQAATSSMKGG